MSLLSRMCKRVLCYLNLGRKLKFMLFHAKNVCFANSWIKVLDVEIAKKKASQ